MSQIILDSANDLIQGDFDNATLSQRTRLQTSTVNATTGVYIIPNGTANAASVQISNNSNVTNASKLVVATNASTDTQIISGANGSGSYLPLSFYTNNDIRFQMGNNGELNVRTAPGTVSSGTSGQFLTSGGPGAGVSWTTVTVPPSGQLRTQLFTAPGTWTNPGSVTQVKVTVVGGGGGGSVSDGSSAAAPAGGGGVAIAAFTIPTSPVAITIGAGGTGKLSPGPGTGGTGGTTSFGAFLSATGGNGGPANTGQGPGTPGSGSISAPITPGALRTSNVATLGGGMGFISGSTTRPGPGNPTSGASVAFSFSSSFAAGAGGDSTSQPAPAPTGGGAGGCNGVVVVEFVG